MTLSTRWFWLTIAVISAALLYLLAPILLPFVAGALLAYLGDPLVDRLETWKISRTLSVLIVFFVLLLLMLPVLFYLIPLLESQIKLLIAKTPGYIDWLMVNLEPTLQETFGFNIPALEIEQLKSTFSEQFSSAGSFIKSLQNRYPFGFCGGRLGRKFILDSGNYILFITGLGSFGGLYT